MHTLPDPLPARHTRREGLEYQIRAYTCLAEEQLSQAALESEYRLIARLAEAPAKAEYWIAKTAATAGHGVQLATWATAAAAELLAEYKEDHRIASAAGLTAYATAAQASVARIETAQASVAAILAKLQTMKTLK